MSIKQLIISLLTLAVKVAVAYWIITHATVWAATAYEFGYRVFTEEAMTDEPGIDRSITITQETTPKQLASNLEDEGLVRDKNLFYIQYLVSEQKDKLVPGQYQLNTSMTADQMLEIMAPAVEEEDAS